MPNIQAHPEEIKTEVDKLTCGGVDLDQGYCDCKEEEHSHHGKHHPIPEVDPENRMTQQTT